MENPPPGYGQPVSDTHPTGMHTYYNGESTILATRFVLKEHVNGKTNLGDEMFLPKPSQSCLSDFVFKIRLGIFSRGGVREVLSEGEGRVVQG